MVRQKGKYLVAGGGGEEGYAQGLKAPGQLSGQAVGTGGQFQIEVIFQKGGELYAQQPALGEDGALLLHAVAEAGLKGMVHNYQGLAEEKTVVTSDPIASPYSKFFDEFSRCWKNNAEYNLMFLRGQQNLANDRLIANGYLFLNDVYDMLDIERTEEGQVVGWVYDKDHPTYIDFGIYNGVRERNRAFVNGYESSILLDFNVQGIIKDKFTKYIRR